MRVASGLRRPRQSLTVRLTLTMAACAGLATASAGTTFDPASCTSLSSAPRATAIDYGAGIQSIFINFNGTVGCADCHTSSGGPAGGLDLDPLETSPYVNLVGVTSAEDSSLMYVRPGQPEQSYLFRKINCDAPGSGQRMPLGFGALSVDQQALIYDWIAAGAPVGTTDQIFRGTFDLRGFVP